MRGQWGIMRPNINEMRVRAAKFSMNWNDAKNENRETQSFYNDFFRIFGINRREVADFEEAIQITKKRKGYIDLFWPKVLIVEQKSAGKNLDEAEEQADRYYGALPVKKRPRYRLVCDFQNFRLFDYTDEEEIRFSLAELKENIKHFEFILDHTFEAYKKQERVSIKASELMGGIHKSLRKSGYKNEDLEIFLPRLTFCLFADDTGIFPINAFQDLIKSTKNDGSDTGALISQIFQVLNTKEDDRENHLNDKMANLPYVNGGLFEETIKIPSFDSATRGSLWRAGNDSDWSDISPAIFGSLFQSVMKKHERREQGAHYTNERDILKLINTLFMDDLQNRFEQIKANKNNQARQKLLQDFQDRLASMTFFDPACGCGNFLVIAYRELRRLEIKVLKLLHQKGIGGEQTELDARQFSKIDVHQFYGIELNDFAVHIARSALWMMDHFMNRELGEELGLVLLRIPLEKSPTIICTDALEMDWAELLPPEKCSFVFGNPPFGGAKKQSDHQRKQVRDIANLGGSGGTLDYVCAWYIKAGQYIQGKTGIGFISTNSITQGQQVAQLWPILFEECGLEIVFAHQSFAWESEAQGQAAVSVIIIGLEKQKDARKNKILYSYESPKSKPIPESVLTISPYLLSTGGTADSHISVKQTSKPLNKLPKMRIGTKPIDGGYYILSEAEKKNLISKEPASDLYIHPFIGGRELTKGGNRYIIHANSIPADLLKSMPTVKSIIAQVRKYRFGKIPAKGKDKESIKPAGGTSLELATTPRKFHITRVPKKPFMVIPRVTTSRRDYIPIAMYNPPDIPNDSTLYIASATPADFALLTSAMHMAWVNAVAGRLGNGYRYSIGVVYNTFPLSDDADLSKLTPFGQAILKARANHPKATLDQLYDPDDMPDDLRKAHLANDRAVDRLYSAQPFADDTARINHLFALYEKQTT